MQMSTKKVLSSIKACADSNNCADCENCSFKGLDNCQDELMKSAAKIIKSYQSERVVLMNKIIELNEQLYGYMPTCPFNIVDCINDPAYLKKYEPEQYYERGCPTSCLGFCTNADKYENED